DGVAYVALAQDDSTSLLLNLVDRGFRGQDTSLDGEIGADRPVFIMMPPLKNKAQQFSVEEVALSHAQSALRAIIENVNRRALKINKSITNTKNNSLLLHDLRIFIALALANYRQYKKLGTLPHTLSVQHEFELGPSIQMHTTAAVKWICQ